MGGRQIQRLLLNCAFFQHGIERAVGKLYTNRFHRRFLFPLLNKVSVLLFRVNARNTVAHKKSAVNADLLSAVPRI